jgi:hypothetical protein
LGKLEGMDVGEVAMVLVVRVRVVVAGATSETE